jgi:hypothetical protein
MLREHARNTNTYLSDVTRTVATGELDILTEDVADLRPAERRADTALNRMGPAPPRV